MKQGISVVINTYNAQKYLARVLETVKDFDEVLICDMESTDNTLDIVKEYGFKVITFSREQYNIVEPAREFAIHEASNPWVLVVDADELVSKELHDYLYEFINNDNGFSGLFIPRKNYTLGQFTRSSYPDYQLRFFLKELTTWPSVIHAVPIVKGGLFHIPKKRKDLAFVHLHDSTWATIVRLNNYTENEVEKRIGTKVTLTKLILLPLNRFIKQYFIKGGIFNGIAGYVQAVRSAYYKFTVLCKIYEKQNNIND